MNKRKKQKSDPKKTLRKRNVRILAYITSILFIVSLILLWNEDIEENNDLSIIGKGDNVIVQIHDPG